MAGMGTGRKAGGIVTAAWCLSNGRGLGQHLAPYGASTSIPHVGVVDRRAGGRLHEAPTDRSLHCIWNLYAGLLHSLHGRRARADQGNRPGRRHSGERGLGRSVDCTAACLRAPARVRKSPRRRLCPVPRGRFPTRPILTPRRLRCAERAHFCPDQVDGGGGACDES